MKTSFNRGSYILWLCVGACSAPFCSASSDTNNYTKLEMHGASYPSACDPVQLKALREKVMASKVPDTAQAWRAVNALLCAPVDETSRAFINSLTPKKVREMADSTGDKQTFKLVARTEELVSDLMAAGNAWAPRIRTEPDKVILQYFADEACVHRRTLKYAASKWTVYEVGAACD